MTKKDSFESPDGRKPDEIRKMESIEIKGIEGLSEAEKQELNKEIETYKEKIKWKTKSDFVLKLDIRSYNKSPENKNRYARKIL